MILLCNKIIRQANGLVAAGLYDLATRLTLRVKIGSANGNAVEAGARATGAEGTLTGKAARAGAFAQRYARAVDARGLREFQSKTRAANAIRDWDAQSEPGRPLRGPWAGRAARAWRCVARGVGRRTPWGLHHPDGALSIDARALREFPPKTRAATARPEPPR